MKFLRRGNLFLINALSALLMFFAVVPVFAGESGQYVKAIDRAMGQELQERVSLQLQQAMATEIVLSYENLLAQQISANTEQIALAVSIEPNPFISIEPKEMMAEVVPIEKAVPVADEEDCFNIQ